jgi:hypothetical protein
MLSAVKLRANMHAVGLLEIDPLGMFVRALGSDSTGKVLQEDSVVQSVSMVASKAAPQSAADLMQESHEPLSFAAFPAEREVSMPASRLQSIAVSVKAVLDRVRAALHVPLRQQTIQQWAL